MFVSLHKIIQGADSLLRHLWHKVDKAGSWDTDGRFDGRKNGGLDDWKDDQRVRLQNA